MEKRAHGRFKGRASTSTERMHSKPYDGLWKLNPPFGVPPVMGGPGTRSDGPALGVITIGGGGGGGAPSDGDGPPPIIMGRLGFAFPEPAEGELGNGIPAGDTTAPDVLWRLRRDALLRGGGGIPGAPGPAEPKLPDIIDIWEPMELPNGSSLSVSTTKLGAGRPPGGGGGLPLGGTPRCKGGGLFGRSVGTWCALFSFTP